MASNKSLEQIITEVTASNGLADAVSARIELKRRLSTVNDSSVCLAIFQAVKNSKDDVCCRTFIF